MSMAGLDFNVELTGADKVSAALLHAQPILSYRVKRRGEYLFGVQTPGTAAGRAEAVSEFARMAVTSQGAALVRQLDALYGRPGGSGGGRILWAAADELADSIVSDIDAATAAAAAEIEREMGEA